MRTSKVHYIAPSAISITPNANNSHRDLAVYIARGTKIKVHSNGVDRLGVNPNTNAYREWTLEGRNRRLADTTGTIPYTIYARLPKSDFYVTPGNAYLVFARKYQYENGDGKWYDKHSYVMQDGLSGQYDKRGFPKVVDDENYWWIRLGDVSAAVNGQRTVTLDTGILGTDQYNEEWDLNPDDLPLRVELTCTVNGEDAGPTPYLKWGQSALLAARIVEGWTADASLKVDHWTITRLIGNEEVLVVSSDSSDSSSSDEGERWPGSVRAALFNRDHIITLFHINEENDDFLSAAGAVFRVTAWGTDNPSVSDSSDSSSDSGSSSSDSSSGSGSSSSDSSDSSAEETIYVPLGAASINIYVETNIIGTKGDSPIAIFRWYKDGLQPVKPVDTSSVEPAPAPTDHTGSENVYHLNKWSRTAPDRPQEGEWALWVCTSTRHGNGIIDAWSDPVRISGTKGTPGEDAKEREWIYKLSNSATLIDDDGAPQTLSVTPSSCGDVSFFIQSIAENIPGIADGDEVIVQGEATLYGWNDGVLEDLEVNVANGDYYELPSGHYVIYAGGQWTDVGTETPQSIDGHTIDDYVPAGWEDNAQVIRQDMRFLYACWRDWNKTTKRWGDFQGPILWSVWGERGIDGDGVQYVFKLYDHELTDDTVENGVTTLGERTNYIPVKPANKNSNGEWLPAANNANDPNNLQSWTDDPESTTVALPYCYCSTIKQINGTWGMFEKLSLWSRYSTDGVSQPGYIKTQEAWSSDAVTTSETTAPATAHGTTDGSQNHAAEQDWHDSTPSNPSNLPYLWRRSRQMVFNTQTRQYDYAAGSSWIYTRLNGTNGTSINTKGTVACVINASDSLPSVSGYSAGDLLIQQGDNTLYKLTSGQWSQSGMSAVADGDSYTVTRDCTIDLDGDGTGENIKGHLVMWSAEASKWIDLGQFKGESGVTYYTHIAWAKIVTLGTPTEERSPGQQTTPNAASVSADSGNFSIGVPGNTSDSSDSDSSGSRDDSDEWPWMGWLIDQVVEDSTNPMLYTWLNVLGPEGNGIASVTRTYARSSQSTSTNDETPPTEIDTTIGTNGWAASSPAVNETYQYLWAKEVIVYTRNNVTTTKYYMIGARGQNGIDAQDAEWAYVRTNVNVAPEVVDDGNYTDSYSHGYIVDDHLPKVKVAATYDIRGNTHYDASGYKTEVVGSTTCHVAECTDDPQGVSADWPYEWEIKRTKGSADANGHRTWNAYSGTMTLHNSLAESVLAIDIDNDSDQFGVDADGKVITQQARTTVATLLYGSVEQAFLHDVGNAPTATLYYEDGTAFTLEDRQNVADVTIAAVDNSDYKQYRVTVTIKATGNNTVVFGNGSNQHSGMYVLVTGSCAKGGPKTIRFSLTKVMSGVSGENPVIYQLAPSGKTFSFSRDALNELTPDARSVNVYVMRTIGNTTTKFTSPTNPETLTNPPTFSWGFDTETTAQYSGLSIGTSIGITKTQASQHYQVWVQLSTGDRETLPIVKDGTNGATTYLADLDNEMDSISCDDTGYPVTQQTVSTALHMYYGSDSIGFTVHSVTRNGTAVTLGSQSNGVTVSFSGGTMNENYVGTMNVAYATTAQIQNGKDEYVITLHPSNVSSTDHSNDRELTFTVNAIIGDVYNLNPSPNQIRVQNNATSFSGLTCGYKKNVNGAVSEHVLPTDSTNDYYIDGKYNIYYRLRSKSDGTLGSTYTLYSGSASIASLNVATYDAVEFIICTNTSSDTTSPQNVIDRETVPVTYDGANGADSSGYALVASPTVLEFHSTGDGAAFTPSSIDATMTYTTAEGGVITPHAWPSGGSMVVGSETWYFVWRKYGADGAIIPTVKNDNTQQVYGWDRSYASSGDASPGYGLTRLNGGVNVSSSTTLTAIEFAIARKAWSAITGEDDIICRVTIPIRKVSDGNTGAGGEDAHEINPNILLRTIFDKDIDFVKEKWTGWNDTGMVHTRIDTAPDTVVQGRKSLRINYDGSANDVVICQDIHSRIQPDTWYTLSFYSYCTSYNANADVHYSVYLYGDAYDSGSQLYSGKITVNDGTTTKEIEDGSGSDKDGYVPFKGSWTGARRTITFRTAATIPSAARIIILAKAGEQLAICMPKLEIGQVATAYVANEDDLTGNDGTDGTDGEDAWTLIVNPGSVIINQSTSNVNDFGLPKNIDFVAKRGNETATVGDITVLNSSYLSNIIGLTVATVNSGNSRLQITGYSKVNNSYVTYGRITCSVPLSYGTSGTAGYRSTTLTVQIDVYVNLLGTWAVEITNQATTAAGQKIETELLPAGAITTAYTAAIEASATGLRSEFNEVVMPGGNKNLFGFCKGCNFINSGWNVVPFIQGYGFVVNQNYTNNDETTMRRGLVTNLGFNGVAGHFVVSCQISVSTGTDLQVGLNLCDVNCNLNEGTVTNDRYITCSEGAWTSVEMHFDIPSDNLNISPSSGNLRNGHILVCDYDGTVTSAGANIYVRHLKIERGDTATPFCEADEDIAAIGQGQMITQLANNGMEYPVTDGGRNNVYYIGSVQPQTFDNNYVDYLVQNSGFILQAGKVYTLSYWARTNNSGLVITSCLCNPDIITDIGIGLYDAAPGAAMESLSSDGGSRVRLSTTWTQYFLRFYVTVTNSNNNPRSLIALRVEKAANARPNGGYYSGDIYISDIVLQEGYVMSETSFSSLISQNARRISLVQQSGLKRTGIDIQNGVIRAQTDNFQIVNSNGQQTFSIDANGNLVSAGGAAFNGIVKASTFYTGSTTKNGDCTINPAAGDKGLFITGAQGDTPYEQRITLPPVAQYEGMILRFLNPYFTRSGISGILVPQGNDNVYIPSTNGTDPVTSKAYQLPINRIVSFIAVTNVPFSYDCWVLMQ